MKFEEAIKQLKPAERFKALIILALISGGVAILTSYLKTDDCRDISNQYDVLVKNHAELMKTNNEIIEDNNEKTKDIMKLDSILLAIISAKSKVTTTNKIYNNINFNQNLNMVYDSSGNASSVGNDSNIVMAVPNTSQLTIMKETKIITEMSDQQKDLMSEALKITKKNLKDK